MYLYKVSGKFVKDRMLSPLSISKSWSLKVFIYYDSLVTLTNVNVKDSKTNKKQTISSKYDVPQS